MAFDEQTILLVAILALGILILVVLLATRRGKAGSPDSSKLELAITDRLHEMQAAMQASLAASQREMAESRAKSQEQAQKLELAVNDRITTLEKGIQESVAAAKKEVTDSKAALDKNAVELNKFLSGMGQTIQKLSSQQEIASKISDDLKFLLEGPKSRGTFGETILEELLERTLPRGIWQRQVPVDGRETVDAAIILKGTVYPIDAKFPKEDYQRFLRAADDDGRREAWKAHLGAVKMQVDSIARKYIKPEAGTAQFALMFIPSEGMYYDNIAETDPFGQPNKFLEYAFEQHVIPVGPTTLFAFLQVIAKAQEGQKLVESAKQLQQQLDKIRLSFDRFYGKYEETGKHLNKAADAYRVGDGHIQRFKDRVDDVLALEFDGVEPTDAVPEVPAPQEEKPSPLSPPSRPELKPSVLPRPAAAASTKADPPSPVASSPVMPKPAVSEPPKSDALPPAPPRKGRAAFKVED